MTDPEVLIPARQGRAVRVARGAAIDVINTHGTQVVEFWAPVNGAAQRPADAHFRVQNHG
jgi:uncharacterized protein